MDFANVNSEFKATASEVLTDALALAECRGQDANEELDTGHKMKLRRRQKMMIPKRLLKITTWNIRTGHHVGQKEGVIGELLRYGIPIAILSELRLIGSGRLRVASPDNNDEWMMLYYSGGEQHMEGVGFALDRKTCDSVIAFQPVSSRIAVLTLEGTIRTHIVAVYAPTEITADSSKDQYYSQLQQVIDSLPHSEFIIVAADTNAHVGSRREGWEETVGHFGHVEMNDNGLRLLTFAASNSLLIGNSYFQHPRKHKLTWRCPKGTDSTVLDYFLIPSRFHSSFQNIRVMRGADCGSDHHLVVMKVKLRLKRNKRISTPVSRRDWSRLADPICKQQFELKLRNRFEILKEPENADEAEEQFASVTVDCANAFCSIMRRRTQAWISNECFDMLDQRKTCKCTNIQCYRELHHAVRQRLKQERKHHWDNVATELENAASRREFRILYITLRRLRGHDRAADECIKKKNGKYVKTNAERLFRWREYFQELYNRPIPETPAPTPTDLQCSSQLISDEPPGIEEIRNAVGRLKQGKAAGCDNVTAEALKGGGNTLLRRLHSLIRLVWTSEQIPTSWKQAILVPIHKKGDKHQCKNYRGISLLSIVGKVFMRVVQQRVQSNHEEVSREERAGFRPGRGCYDQIFALQQVMEERIRCGKRLIIVFIDFAAAFDSVYHPALWNTLEAEGIPGKIIRLLQNTYDGPICKVRVRGGMSESFTVSTGVRQECVILPLLFNTVIDAIMRRVFKKRVGVECGQQQFVTDLMYADDVAIFANDEAEATSILNDISVTAQPYGLIINAEKTKLLTTDGAPVVVQLNEAELEQVQNSNILDQ